jgi:hypothetical protein
MRTSKTNSSMPDFKFKAKKSKMIHPENILIHPRFEVKTTAVVGQKASNSLLAVMYSQENEVLFI